jgi:hypothetical protein
LRLLRCRQTPGSRCCAWQLSIAVRNFLERGGAANGAIEPAQLFVIDKPIRSITAAIEERIEKIVSLHFCWGRAMQPARQFPFRTLGPMLSLKVA